MKKFLALVVITIMTTALVVGAAKSTNAEVKSKSSFAISYATMGAVVAGNHSGGGSRKASIFRWCQKKFPKNPVIADSYIRMEAYLVNGKAEYEFFHRLLGTEASTERKLNEQDAFRITDVGIFLMRESTTVAGIGQLSTYPNPIQFPDGAAGFTVNEHLEALYNGYLTAKIGDTTWLPDLPVMDCRVVNTAQQTVLATNDSERRPGDGMIPLTPQYTLYGRENNSLKLVIPANSSQKFETDYATVGYKHKVVLILKGYKITGAGNPPATQQERV